MNWSKTAPTKAEDWKWRSGEGGGEYAGNVVKTEEGLFFAFYLGFKPVTELGGEWLPLFGGDVLAAEVEKAADEASTYLLYKAQVNHTEDDFKRWFEQSRAKRITTGETEPSL